MTTEVWHRDHVKVVDDPFDRDADVDVEERGVTMGASIKCNRERISPKLWLIFVFTTKRHSNDDLNFCYQNET